MTHDELVLAITSGDREAFARLVERESLMVYRVCYASGGPRETAEPSEAAETAEPSEKDDGGASYGPEDGPSASDGGGGDGDTGGGRGPGPTQDH